MDSTELLNDFRGDMVDQVEPYLWTDAEIYRYADAAQKWFCRLTGGIGDATGEMTRLVIPAGTVWVPLSPLILKVRDAYRVADGKPITVENYETLVQAGVRLDYTVGTIQYLVLGMEPKKLRVFPTPQSDDEIQLLVDRLPLKNIDDADINLEVDSQHKEGLLLWMKHLAYLKQDAETFDKTKAAEFEDRFMRYCDAASVERTRVKHKTRTVSYGGY